MRISEILVSAREKYLTGKCRIFGSEKLIDQAALVPDADAMELLDKCVPGGNFGLWLDGARWTGAGVVFEYNRTPREIEAVLSKAIVRAELQERE